MRVKTFVCNMLHENCYVIYDETTREAAIIDPGFYWDEEKRKLAKFIEENDLGTQEKNTAKGDLLLFSAG